MILAIIGAILLVVWVVWAALRAEIEIVHRLRRMEARQGKLLIKHESMEAALARIERAVGDSGPAAIVGAFARHLETQRQAAIDALQPGDARAERTGVKWRSPAASEKPGKPRADDARAKL